MSEYTIRSEYASTIAIDQHARSITMVALDLTTAETITKKMTNCPTAGDIVAWASEKLSTPMRFVYESGPCGFQLARDIRALGYDCDIIAVSSIPRSNEDKVFKDDRRDAQRLLDAVISPGSKCKCVWIPKEENEAARDLVRAYHDLVSSTKRLKVQLSAMLLRHGYVWNERTPSGSLRATWTREYIKWVSSIKLNEELDNITLKIYLEAALASIDRCKKVKSKCIDTCNSEQYKPYIDALTRLKGVDEMTALTYLVTIDEFSRFKNGRSVSKYFGLTPSRNDSGEKIGHNGHITKSGDTTVRKAIIEGLTSLPSYNTKTKWPRKGHEVSAAIEAEAQKCNLRHIHRYKDLIKAGKKANVAKVAIASEMVRDMWIIGLMVERELKAK